MPTFISLLEIVFRKTIGIRMGTDCAPCLANLFLYRPEFKYMDRMCKENYNLVTKLSFTFNYIDDLIIVILIIIEEIATHDH